MLKILVAVSREKGACSPRIQTVSYRVRQGLKSSESISYFCLISTTMPLCIHNMSHQSQRMSNKRVPFNTTLVMDADGRIKVNLLQMNLYIVFASRVLNIFELCNRRHT